jgi:SulP family sulfate permease
MRYTASTLFKNIIIGLAVSVVMLNLGAALGILSGRGAFAGMLSAGLIAFVTSTFGGTRIQGSGTTAPMSTVTAVVVAYAAEQLPTQVAGIEADHFVNIVIALTGCLLILFGCLRLGRFISYVPNLVISGFMCGIALIIWMLQFNLLFGIGREPIAGPMYYNVMIALTTLSLAFAAPVILKRFLPGLSKIIPGTLVALVLVSIGVNLAHLPVAFLNVETSIKSFGDFHAYLQTQIPSHIDLNIIMLALPFAVKLAALCYIDTLLTSLIIDKMRQSKTRQNKELLAQGLASSLVAFIGGVPGAQSTVPSVLTVKEGATMRLAGICAGIFVLLELILLADLMNYIPQAVFAGILIKVGYDVFDFKAMYGYARAVRRSARNLPSKILGHKEMTILSGTAFVTAFVDLIVAVGAFTLGVHLFNKYARPERALNDFVP